MGSSDVKLLTFLFLLVLWSYSLYEQAQGGVAYFRIGKDLDRVNGRKGDFSFSSLLQVCKISYSWYMAFLLVS